MSALTKVFVVLLVVLSLLLAAASVTFLNTLPDYQQQLATLRAANDASQSAALRIEQQTAAERAALNARVQELSSALADAQTNVTGLRSELAQTRAEQAELEGQLAQANTTQVTLASAVQASQNIVQELRQQVANLGQEYDRTLSQFTETSRELAQTTNELTFATRQLREAQELNQELLSQSSDLRGALQELGVNPEQLTVADIAPPPINGVVLSVESIGNKPYALISVGSEDDVKPGMRFTVLDTSTSQFLGYLTIEQVDDTQSIGQLTGPNIDAVSASDEVRTQV